MTALPAPDTAEAGVDLPVEHLLGLRHVVRADIAVPRALTALPGGFVVRRRGRGLEVDDIRVFAEGDDVRHIDRNTTARTGIPHVRTFRDERERTLILLVDLRPSMLWGTRRAFRSVAAAEAAALAGWRAIDGGGRVGLVAFGTGDPVVVPARGRDRGMIAVAGGLAHAHAQALRDAASTAQDRSEPPLAAALDLAARLAPRGASVLLASGLDQPGAGFDEAAGALTRRADLAALIVVDAFERRASPDLLPFVDASGTRRLGRVAETFDADRDPRFTRLRRLGVDAVPITTTDEPATMLAALEALDGSRR